MSLKYKQKVYLSLDNGLLEFVEEQSQVIRTTKSKFIRQLLIKEFDNYKQKKIDQIIEGKKEF